MTGLVLPYSQCRDSLSVLSPAGYADSNFKKIQSRLDGVLNLKEDYFAKGNDIDDDSAAYDAWFADIIASGKPGYIPKGKYKLNSARTMDFNGQGPYGIQMFGDGRQQSILHSTVSSGTAFDFKISGGTGPSDQVPSVYNSLEDIGFLGDTSGVFVRFGQDNYADAFGSSIYRNLWFVNLNSSHNTGAVTTRFNEMFNCTLDNVVSDGDNVGWAGTAMQIRLMVFCTIISSSVGNCDTGLHITGSTNYGNVFTGFDIENVKYCVNNDSSSTGAHTFIGGQFDPTRSSGYALKSSAMGSNGLLLFDNVNFADLANPYYNGLGAQVTAIDPSNYTGIMVRGKYGDTGSVTVPASNATVTNKTGQKQRVSIWGGTVSTVNINGYTYPITSGQFIIQPGDTIGWTGSSAPSWVWSAMWE